MYYAEEAIAGTIPSEVEIHPDAELGSDAVELLGPQARITIPCKADLPFLILHLKDLNKFLSVEIAVVDDTRRVRRITATNRVSTARIEADAATIPLLLDHGVWNYVCLPLHTLSSNAFGAVFKYCKEVSVTANTVLGRAFFTDKQYEDAELPPFLRVIP